MGPHTEFITLFSLGASIGVGNVTTSSSELPLLAVRERILVIGHIGERSDSVVSYKYKYKDKNGRMSKYRGTGGGRE